MREVLQVLLCNLGHEVVVAAENGRSLMEQCAIMRPDVVITDNRMPEMSGAEAAAIIYNQRPMPIILLSAFCDRELVVDAEQKHVFMYLVKPASEAHLQVALDRCQELRNAQECDGAEAELGFKNSNWGSSGSSLNYRRATSPYRQMPHLH